MLPSGVSCWALHLGTVWELGRDVDCRAERVCCGGQETPSWAWGHWEGAACRPFQLPWLSPGCLQVLWEVLGTRKWAGGPRRPDPLPELLRPGAVHCVVGAATARLLVSGKVPRPRAALRPQGHGCERATPRSPTHSGLCSDTPFPSGNTGHSPTPSLLLPCGEPGHTGEPSGAQSPGHHVSRAGRAMAWVHGASWLCGLPAYPTQHIHDTAHSFQAAHDSALTPHAHITWFTLNTTHDAASVTC